MVGPLDVKLDWQCAATSSVQLGGNHARFVDEEVRYAHRRTFVREESRLRAANSATATGDQRDLALESHVSIR